MTEAYDVAVIGSGFAGSLTATLLKRIGLRTALVDRVSHPRFAIGESSTPIANMVLRDLCRRFDLPRIASLSRYGDWLRRHAQLRRGCKRGFSYFAHAEDLPFSPRPDHANELLVAASGSEAVADTQWFRADVDQYLVGEAEREGVETWLGAGGLRVERDGNGWALMTQSRRLEASFLVDASGGGGALARTLSIGSATDQLKTRTSAIYAHFEGVESWDQALRESGAGLEDHPFPSDNAAQHHLGRDGWMWLLRFDDGRASAGIVTDQRRGDSMQSHQAAADRTGCESRWRDWLRRHPSVEALFQNASIAEPPGRILGSGRLQRMVATAAGGNWAMLPNTAGFVDPLHSTGIAHSLCGVERLVHTLQEYWNRPQLPRKLDEYQRTVLAELRFIDRLVDGCYRAMDEFPVFVAFSMFYFAAATTYEQRRAEQGFGSAFLCADDAPLRDRLDEAYAEITSGEAMRNDSSIVTFQHRVSDWIKPYNHVGLCDDSAFNMYRYTAAPDSQ